MTATARPQHVVDAAETAVAGHRATVGELLTAYRDTTARLGDPLAAYAGVAGAAYTEMCARQLSQVLAAAVQMLAEARDAAELMPFPVEATAAEPFQAIEAEPFPFAPDPRPKCGVCGCPKQWHRKAGCSGDFFHCPCTGYVAQAVTP